MLERVSKFETKNFDMLYAFEEKIYTHGQELCFYCAMETNLGFVGRESTRVMRD